MTERTTLRMPGFRGDVITPEHHEYDVARAVWNGRGGDVHTSALD